MKKYLSPSMLSADFTKVGEQLKTIENAQTNKQKKVQNTKHYATDANVSRIYVTILLKIPSN